MDNEALVGILTVVCVTVITCVTVTQVQATNRKLVEGGYEQCSIKGVDYKVWQKNCK